MIELAKVHILHRNLFGANIIVNKMDKICIEFGLPRYQAKVLVLQVLGCSSDRCIPFIVLSCV
jgi:hypothetical protein